LNALAPRTPPEPHAHLRHALQIALFNTVLWLMQLGSGIERWGNWDKTLVYTQAIGLSIWAIIDFGRGPLLRPTDLHWPSPGRATALIVTGVIGGFTIGSLVGDWYSGAPLFGFALRPFREVRSGVMFTAVASSIAVYFFYTRGRAAVQRERIAQAERDATLARMALLQSQLEPHMLFNTLANLRVLIELDPVRAQAMLDRLIAFLRATLSASRTPSHSLAAEFERLADYLELMAVRMGPRLHTRFELPEALRALEVPPMLLQPLVENAIQHGLEPQPQGGRVEVIARRSADALELEVRDSGVGLHEAPPSNGTRFGLKQVRERLQTLYGQAATLQLQAVEQAAGGGTRALVRLPLR
jgi:hypothetical protein